MYHDMTKLLNQATIGDFKLQHFEIEKPTFASLRDGIPVGKYIRLTHKGEVVMSDTPMEKRTNYDFVRKAYGDVLIGGLGIGMIVMAIQDKDNVKSITIIEKHQEVIDLVANQLPFNCKVHIINADVFTWKPQNGQRFDCIYMDIWNYISNDVYHEEMKPLKRKYGHYLKSLTDSPNRFNKCWAEWNAKTECRLY